VALTIGSREFSILFRVVYEPMHFAKLMGQRQRFGNACDAGRQVLRADECLANAMRYQVLMSLL